jgi:hypothetical protein
VFPNGLRRARLVVITLAEHYGIPRDQEVADHEWMLEAARHGWPVLGCDAKHRRRRRPAERAALIQAGVQNFVLNGNVSALENVERVLHNLAAILAACATPGPFVYRIHPARTISNDFRSTDDSVTLPESVAARVVADVAHGLQSAVINGMDTPFEPQVMAMSAWINIAAGGGGVGLGRPRWSSWAKPVGSSAVAPSSTACRNFR